MRKKFSQVSTLHVIHHGIMPMSVWMGMKFAPGKFAVQTCDEWNDVSRYMTVIFLYVGGHSTFFALLNTFVHIVMYFYYMVSAMGPEYQKYIWWKKYLTAFQMVSTKFQVVRRDASNWRISDERIFCFLGTIHLHFHSPIPITIRRMRLSEKFHGMDRTTWRSILSIVLGIL